MSDPTPTPKRRGCFFYGCVSLVVLMFIGVVLIVVVALNAPKVLTRIALPYTDTAPVQLERVEVSAAELKALQQRVAVFQEALQGQKTAQELVLTDHDINALIGNDPNLKEFRDKLLVTIEGETIRGKVSWPLPDVGPFKLKGRYLNGDVAFKVSLQDRHLGVFIEDLKVKGQPVPGLVLSRFKTENLAEGMQRDPATAAEIEKFDTIKIENGKLILRNRPQESSSPPPAER